MTSLEQPVLVDESSLTRRVTVTPGMCGGSQFFGQLGDWTWEAVNSACGTNVYNARNPHGQPTYLAFYYYRVRGSERFHPYSITFGDELDVTSRVFDLGRQSVMTLHRVSRSGDADEGRPLDPVEFYEQPRADCLYVENFNRWISRGEQDSNQGLVESAPVGFRHEHLPGLPSAHSPRGVCGEARRRATFHPSGIPGYVPAAEPDVMTYVVDTVRDLNGVGLMYFASYFSIIDTALLRLWRKLDRTDREFIGRRVLDHQLGYFGNADLESVFVITVNLWRNSSVQGDEIADIAIRDRDTERLLAVSSVRLSMEQP